MVLLNAMNRFVFCAITSLFMKASWNRCVDLRKISMKFAMAWNVALALKIITISKKAIRSKFIKEQRSRERYNEVIPCLKNIAVPKDLGYLSNMNWPY